MSDTRFSHCMDLWTYGSGSIPGLAVASERLAKVLVPKLGLRDAYDYDDQAIRGKDSGAGTVMYGPMPLCPNIDVCNLRDLKATPELKEVLKCLGLACRWDGGDGHLRFELIHCQRADAHFDWDTRFFSVVLGTSLSGDSTGGYTLSLTPVPDVLNEDCMTESSLSAAAHPSELHRLSLTTGTVFSFNPGATAHWVEPDLREKGSVLLLLQAELPSELDMDARRLIEARAGRLARVIPFGEASIETTRAHARSRGQ